LTRLLGCHTMRCMKAMEKPISKEIRASITERGQVTLPAEVRKHLGLKPGEKVVFVIDDGVVTIKRPAFTLKSAGASVPPLKKKLEWREMIEIAYEDAADEYARKNARE
jgi:antitoxin PrlF